MRVLTEPVRFVTLTIWLGFGATALVLAAAAIGGLKIGVEAWPLALTTTLFALLLWVRRRHERLGGDKRVANCAGVVLALSCGGLAGGLICLLGQTFALPFIDPLLHRADLALGVDVEAVIRTVAAIPVLPTFLGAAYQVSFPLIFGSALYFAWIGRNERAWELCAIFNLCLLVTAISSTVLPAMGAFHYLAISADVRDSRPRGAGIYHLHDLFRLRTAERFVIDPTHLQGVATFPSFHVMLALMTAAAWRDVPKIFSAMCCWQGLVILSTIPIGGHYFIDLLAGAICWGLVQFMWRRSSTAAEPAPRSREPLILA